MTSSPITTLLTRFRRKLFFRSHRGNFYAGVYRTFEAAQRAIRTGTTVGYDNAVAASFYREMLDRIQPDDYPVLYWLRPLVRDHGRVFDFGGHIGLHFYGYRRFLDLPATLRWDVGEVAAVRAAGETLASERGVSSQLRFVGGLAPSAGADVLISSGALQYLDVDYLLRELWKLGPAAPPHLLLNKLPMVDGDSFCTVQDTGVFAAPYTVFSRPGLMQGLGTLGYELVDSWSNPGHHCFIAGAPESSVREYSGVYLRRGRPPTT